jgi:hypothetical protein
VASKRDDVRGCANEHINAHVDNRRVGVPRQKRFFARETTLLANGDGAASATEEVLLRNPGDKGDK